MHSSRFAPRLLFVGLFLVLVIVLAGCGEQVATPTATALPPTATVPQPTPTQAVPPTYTSLPAPSATPTSAATATPSPIPLSERGFVPILCYHHIRDWKGSDTQDDRGYIMPPARLETELKWLKENGYHTITAEQMYEYVKNGWGLPTKPIMLTFDDNDGTQYTNAVPLLKQYGLGATFFIMTVTIDKENYMTADQLKELDKAGFDLQPHTWDHHMVTQYKTDEDWQRQLVEPRKTLEALLGHPTPFFAYPFGVYDGPSARKIEELGYKAAFRLSDLMDKDVKPEFAIKRYIANGYWTLDQFVTVVKGGWE